MSTLSQLLSVDQAVAIIDAAAVTPRIVNVPLASAMGMRLARQISADSDYPPFDKSLMDGFAVRCADIVATPTELPLAGEIPAGKAMTQPLQPGHAVAIMTGAPLPSGADGIIAVEETLAAGPNVRILGAPSPGRYIARAGSDIKKGQVILRAGAMMNAAQLAAAATVGAAHIDVFARPRVGILSTGDEVVPFDQTPTGASIRNSNSIMLLSLVRQFGCEPIELGHVPDDPARIRTALAEGIKLDVLLVTGGMSMGKFDFVPGLLDGLGVEVRISKLRIKPGKPFVFGLGKACFIFGLPGNPVSGFVCTVRLVSRLLCRLGGGEIGDPLVPALLTEPVGANGPREFYLPAVLLSHNSVRPLTWKGSADLFTLANATALIRLPENSPALPAGAAVSIIPL